MATEADLRGRANALRKQAQRAQRLAAGLMLDPAGERLLKLARDLEAEATELEQHAGGGDQGA
jgi:hypothetical protein